MLREDCVNEAGNSICFKNCDPSICEYFEETDDAHIKNLRSELILAHQQLSASAGTILELSSKLTGATLRNIEFIKLMGENHG